MYSNHLAVHCTRIAGTVPAIDLFILIVHQFVDGRL